MSPVYLLLHIFYNVKIHNAHVQITKLLNELL